MISVNYLKKPLFGNKQFVTCCVSNFLKAANLNLHRNYASHPKRFYKKTGVIYSNGIYEITLDNRKLKTPKGNIFQVDSELLALAVAKEWDSQKPIIHRSSMHLTSLCNTAQDNPNTVKKIDAVQYILNFLETDTILYESNNDELSKLQQKEWRPVVKWFNERYQTELVSTCDITSLLVPPDTKDKIERHLLSYSLTALHGFLFAVDTLKSVILTLACVDKKLSVSQAVLLSKLEEEYQTGHWGRVEWAHDISQYDSQCRLAAAIIFIQLNSMSEDIKSKLTSVV